MFHRPVFLEIAQATSLYGVLDCCFHQHLLQFVIFYPYTMSTMSRTIFVIGATGKQGRTVSRELLSRGFEVHILVREDKSDAAQHLAALGGKLFVGDLTSTDSIRKALVGVDAVFLALPAHPTLEVEFARNVLDTARETQIKSIVYSSVARAGDHELFPGWSDNYPLAWYWKNKNEIEHMVRGAGFPYWTILKPAFFTLNFCRPECEHMFPGLAEAHEYRTAFDRSTRLDLINVSDIATIAVAVLQDPTKCSGKSIPLAGESLTAEEISSRLSFISGAEISVHYLDEAEIEVLQKQGSGAIKAQLWQKNVGYNVDQSIARQYGFKFEPMSEALQSDTLGW